MGASGARGALSASDAVGASGATGAPGRGFDFATGPPGNGRGTALDEAQAAAVIARRPRRMAMGPWRMTVDIIGPNGRQVQTPKPIVVKSLGLRSLDSSPASCQNLNT